MSDTQHAQDSITYDTDLSRVDWQAMIDALVADDFHNGRTVEQMKASFENSYRAVIAYDQGRIIGTARVLSDGVCNAYVVDVWAHSDYRRRGIGSEIMRRLIEPLHGQHVYLFTDSAPEFYEALGFEPQGEGMYRIVGEWLVNQPADTAAS